MVVKLITEMADRRLTEKTEKMMDQMTEVGVEKMTETTDKKVVAQQHVAEGLMEISAQQNIVEG